MVPILSQNCGVVVSWAKAGDKFKFEAEADYSADADVENKWVGVGLSLDGGRAMGNDAAVACFFGWFSNLAMYP